LIIARVVFKVGVLHEDDVASNFRKATSESGAFTLIAFLKKDAEVAKFDGIAAIEGGGLRFAQRLQLREFFEDLASAVGGAVVDQDDFLAKGSFNDAAKDFVDGGFFVVNGNDDGKFGGPPERKGCDDERS
jgi:hypothetical protein